MTNEKKFKTADERIKAFNKFCKENYCEGCSCKEGTMDYRTPVRCMLAWLELEYIEEVKLKPCPFCGSTPVIANNMESMRSLSYYVKCDCGARLASALSTSAAAEMWNRRAK